MRSFAFVVPRFGEGIVGGAETLVAALASKLNEGGDEVEVWTTCARDNRTWENYFPQGNAVEFGLPVKRFSVNERNLELWIPHQIAISEGLKLSVNAQLDWMTNGVNSNSLYEHIKKEAAHFHAIFFAPYLFGTTFFGSLICPERSILIPCLHDEHYAYTEIVQSMFRQVKGCLFNSIPEQELAEVTYGSLNGSEVGMGFDVGIYRKREPYFKEAFPYILYVGRKETGKNVQVLIDCFIAYKELDSESPLKLVIAGGGDFQDLQRPNALDRKDVIDLSHVSEEEKQGLIQNCLFLCQPSRNESFSIVLMEAWLQGSPVVVDARCPVTRHHVVESGGGLYFSSEEDLIGICREFLANSQLRLELAEAGRAYVKSRYSWDAVLKRFNQAIDLIFKQGAFGHQSS
ncbi:MAG: glycosyltransferase family 4 protein [SAR324 cluster bacterium]|uniref:Glycosyltransferase family 4 protein n=1 Tax=SAR324 cluster bacterium TaxID=2024889 RepID=A0A7X9FR01_9DELT|nr:glycosyltransferase family 4 protein [SAR324 cluster bacterium]